MEHLLSIQIFSYVNFVYILPLVTHKGLGISTLRHVYSVLSESLIKEKIQLSDFLELWCLVDDLSAVAESLCCLEE